MIIILPETQTEGHLHVMIESQADQSLTEMKELIDDLVEMIIIGACF